MVLNPAQMWKKIHAEHVKKRFIILKNASNYPLTQLSGDWRKEHKNPT